MKKSLSIKFDSWPLLSNLFVIWLSFTKFRILGSIVSIVYRLLGKNKYLYTYQMRPKFLFGVILCAQPPAFMTPFARKQLQNVHFTI